MGRRGFMATAAGLLVAPWVVRAESLMKVVPVDPWGGVLRETIAWDIRTDETLFRIDALCRGPSGREQIMVTSRMAAQEAIRVLKDHARERGLRPVRGLQPIPGMKSRLL